jgi:hypothetical protein
MTCISVDIMNINANDNDYKYINVNVMAIYKCENDI